ncbi:MAG: sulfatase [Acidobacteria bacterium]|nr:sulfatase [Acidobacteriota bacterium]
MICWRNVVAGAIQGVMAWTAYAAVECCFLSILPRLWQTSFSVAPPEWRQAVGFFAIYPIVGLLLGGVMGLALELAAWRMQGLRKRDSTRLLSAAALFTLIWALAINLAVLSPPGASVWVRLFVTILLSAALAWSVRPGFGGERLGFLLNPWSLSLLLLGLPWMGSHLPLHSSALTRPNVVLVVMDTVRADHLSVYGYERDTTPNLKRFAEEATFFSRAIAPSDITLSSHASLFTGLYARRHGARLTEPGGHAEMEAGSPLAAKFHTLAEILTENGYRTMGVVANYIYLSRDFGMDQGFGYYSVAGAPPPPLELPSFHLAAGLHKLAPVLSAGGSSLELHSSAEKVNRQVFPLLERARQEHAPFFLFINYMDAHEPLLPPPPYDTLFPGKDSSMDPGVYYKVSQDVNRLQSKMTETAKRHAISQYDGGIAYLDFHLGNLFRRLRELGLYDNSLIIITSDHGEAFGDRNVAGHGGISVYQDVAHIPLLIRYPHAGPKAVVEEPVSLVDILPTVLDVLQPSSGGPRLVISECFPGLKLLNLHPRFRRVERALVAGSWKFIHSTTGKRELYDLSKDPNETRNLYSTGDGVSRELEARLNQWLETVPPENPSVHKLNKETLERLKSLGYIQ